MQPAARALPSRLDGRERPRVALEERDVRAVAADGDLDGERAAPGQRGERLADQRRLAVAARRDEEDLLAGGQIADQPVELGLAVDEGRGRDDLAVDERVVMACVELRRIDVTVTSVNVTSRRRLVFGRMRELAWSIARVADLQPYRANRLGAPFRLSPLTRRSSCSCPGVDRHADHGVDAGGVERSISSCVVMPPAAVTRRAVAARTAMMASSRCPASAPRCRRACRGTRAQNGSSARTASTAVIGSAVFQPWITTRPPRLSTAAITRSAPTASASDRANATSRRRRGRAPS